MKLAERTDAEELQAETKNILEAAHRIQNITHQLARAIRSSLPSLSPESR